MTGRSTFATMRGSSDAPRGKTPSWHWRFWSSTAVRGAAPPRPSLRIFSKPISKDRRGAKPMILDRRFWFGIDWLLVLGLALAAGLGVAAIYSATQGGPNPDYYRRQLLWIVLGFGPLLPGLALDYHSLV